ncbi:MAG: hypothetical protein K2N03_01970 [Muribaculaceae bacterium]|nr:hypothetical protein [Muribaculaceae bacterium]
MNEGSVFDEDKAIEFIRKYVGEEISQQYSDDEILYVIDIIWDYYEKNGYLTLDAEITEEELLDVDSLTAYVRKEIANDKEIIMDPKDLEKIVKGELEYEESLEDIL